MYKRFAWIGPLVFFAGDDGSGGGGDNSGDNGGTNNGDKGGDSGKSDGDKGGDSGEPDKKFTQADLDRAAASARRDERKKATDEAADRARRDAQTETERLKEDAERAKQQAADAKAAADARIVRSEAKVVAAAELSVPAKSIPHLIKLAALDKIEVGDDGEPDAKAITAALKAVLDDVPALLGDGNTGNSSSATNAGRSGRTEGPKTLREALAAKLGAN